MNKCKVLVVDDDPELSHLLAVILDRIGGYEVKVENLSNAAFRTAKTFKPNIILLDMKMPGQDGDSVCAEISSDPELSKTPIIFVTGTISPSEAGYRGGYRCLPKPINPGILLDTVANLYSEAYRPSAS